MSKQGKPGKANRMPATAIQLDNSRQFIIAEADKIMRAMDKNYFDAVADLWFREKDNTHEENHFYDFEAYFELAYHIGSQFFKNRAADDIIQLVKKSSFKSALKHLIYDNFFTKTSYATTYCLFILHTEHCPDEHCKKEWREEICSIYQHITSHNPKVLGHHMIEQEDPRWNQIRAALLHYHYCPNKPTCPICSNVWKQKHKFTYCCI